MAAIGDCGFTSRMLSGVPTSAPPPNTNPPPCSGTRTHRSGLLRGEELFGRSYGCRCSPALGTNRKYTCCGTSVSQCRVTFAYPTSPKKMIAIPAATTHAGTALLGGPYFPSVGKCGNTETTSVSLAGHTARHSKQPVHSADRICTSLSTGSDDGHTFAHFAQSMQPSSRRLMRTGLASAASPSSAPYGHK